MSFPEIARSVVPVEPPQFRFSICTLVSNPSEYGEMVDSFVGRGFDPADCEFLYCDNSASNQMDAFAAYNLFLHTARGEFIILCHQDVLLIDDGREKLEEIVRDLDARDQRWALLGNAGAAELGYPVICITHGDGSKHNSGEFPVQVRSLDENFIVAKRSANLCVSHDLRGYHFYGTDLCQVAGFLGRTAWVVDFHLLHKSTGKIDATFDESYRAICRKYRTALPDGYIQTTCAVIPTGRSDWWLNRAAFLRIRTLERGGLLTPEIRLEHDRLMSQLGRRRYFQHLIRYKIAVPRINLIRSFRKRRALFLQLQALKRYGGDTRQNREACAYLRRRLGWTNYVLQLALYKMAAPYFNLVKSLKKRL